MKKLNMILATSLAVSAFAYAGGDILPPVFEQEEVVVPIEEYVAPVKVTPKPTPVVVQPQPIVPLLNNIVPLGLYVGLGLTAARYEPSCGCVGTGDVDNTLGIVGRLGYDFNQYVGIEARGIRTNWNSNGGKFEHYGAFVKPMYPVSNAINVYGLAGVAATKTERSTTRQYVDANGFAWGAGLEYDLGRDVAKAGRYSRNFDGYGDQEGGWGLFADYERLLQKSGSPDFDTISAGITYDF